jgi:ABC-type antimicrobial peptide transport system permease subunit
VLENWFLEGRFLIQNQSWEAVVGDTLAQTMFSSPLNETISVSKSYFQVVGICSDPINNGNVTYVPLEDLKLISGVSEPNIILIRISPSANSAETLNEIEAVVGAYRGFGVYELNGILDKDLDFLGYTWSTIMFMPLISLATASLCLIGYVMLALTEQGQEFGVLRALGTKPRTVVKILSGQSIVVLLSSYVAGIALGTMITLLILIPQPLVTSYTIVEIAGWMLIALAVTFVLSLYPAIRFARRSIIEIMSQA